MVVTYWTDIETQAPSLWQRSFYHPVPEHLISYRDAGFGPAFGLEPEGSTRSFKSADQFVCMVPHPKFLDEFRHMKSGFEDFLSALNYLSDRVHHYPRPNFNYERTKAYVQEKLGDTETNRIVRELWPQLLTAEGTLVDLIETWPVYKKLALVLTCYAEIRRGLDFTTFHCPPGIPTFETNNQDIIQTLINQSLQLK